MQASLYFLNKEKEDYFFVGLTHSDITDGKKNIPLDHNPNPKDKSKAYIRPYTEKSNRSKFGSKLKGWFMIDSDKNKIKK